ncbi:MAG: hypothetical protein JXA89_12715 [Anaerolineae bacterium]|nr:hypothetical protein [Anaerolineae bacterium]
MLQQLFAQMQNYALILLLFALLAYSLIGFSIDVSAAQTEEPAPGQVEPVPQDSVEQELVQLTLADPAHPSP